MKLLLQRMFATISLCLSGSILFCNICNAQSQALPFIRPAEYKIKIETSFPYHWDPNCNIFRYGARKTYSLTKGGGYFDTYYQYSIGADTTVFYVAGMNTPDKLSVQF